MSTDKPKPTAADDAKPPASDPKAGARGSGRVKFDDRGNAIWEWSVATGAFGREITSDRLKRLENPTLSIADDSPSPDAVRANPLGTKKGYDPYDSGRLGKRPDAPRKKDLRRLGEFLKMKRQAAGNKDEE